MHDGAAAGLRCGRALLFLLLLTGPSTFVSLLAFTIRPCTCPPRSLFSSGGKYPACQSTGVNSLAGSTCRASTDVTSHADIQQEYLPTRLGVCIRCRGLSGL